MKFNTIENKIFDFLIGENTKSFIEKTILYISILGFLVHLLLIYLFQSNTLVIDDPYNLLSSPISAIYTPFSFILIYEIYQLIYYLPRSISVYISKQYEIITLIIIRRIFKDISNLNLNKNLFTSNINEYLFVDLFAAVTLFFLIFLFRLSFQKKKMESPETPNLLSFIRVKKWISALLVPVVFILAITHFYGWTIDSLYNDQVVYLKSLNSIFFDELFQTLILVDVFLLLFSFFNSDRFHNIMRNSGFIISTILIRLSFLTEGLNNVALIIISVLFGLFIQLIFNACEKKNLF